MSSFAKFDQDDDYFEAITDDASEVWEELAQDRNLPAGLVLRRCPIEVMPGNFHRRRE